MEHELEVWLFDGRVGSLSLVHGRLSFAYASDWLALPQATALSQSLPLQAEPFDDHQTRPFFAGLLPEGQMRRLIAQQFQVSGQNDFALLDHIGGECAGAVTFLEPGQALPQGNVTGAAGDVEWLSDEKLLALLDELPRRPMLAGADGLRLSLAGAQDKLPVVVDESIPGAVRIGLPRNGAPSSHILKPAIHAVADSVANEGFCMLLAEVMGLRPASARIHSVLSRSFLLVERYDRVLKNDAQHSSQLQRMHQEDFCQALGVVPEMKYQNEGGPGLAQCFTLLRSVTRPSAPQVLRLLDGTIFNALVGNHDAHGKNFSLLYGGRSPVLAPFYDLLATAIYPQLTPKMAMKIGSKYKFSELEARHWEQFAEEAGLAKAATRKRLQTLATELPTAARKLQAAPQHGFEGNAVVEQIAQLIEQRCALTIKRLASG
ncbi:type II toxin-antitoxin system HipA family toxin [Comamonas guangdongensis]|uniref:Type II toxin-antitoxin system HipA family toxin n=1 Tax=Comamonas guangdongensis TaxID=510515 RepID=A0ABV3ZX78_9BURK